MRGFGAAVLVAPANLTLPTLAGTTAVGDTLTATAGTWDGVPAPVLTYTWERDGTPIGGETGLTYTVASADAAPISTTITVVELATNAVSTATAESTGTTIPYDPAYEPGLFADWYADAGITSAGTGVSSWVEGVSSVDFVQGTDGKRPTYEAAGLNSEPSVLAVLANADALTTATFADASNDWTLIAFCEPVTNAPTMHLLDSQTGRLVFAQCSSTANKVGYYDGAYQTSGEGSTAVQALTWVLDSAGGGDVLRGEASIGTDTYADQAIGGNAALFANFSGGGNHANIRIGRMMLFTTLDSARDARVRAWGSTKYGT